MPIDSAHSSVIQAVDVEIIDVYLCSEQPVNNKAGRIATSQEAQTAQNGLSRSTSATGIGPSSADEGALSSASFCMRCERFVSSVCCTLSWA